MIRKVNDNKEMNMFSLIIVMISILLVAVLAAAVIYYGGDSFNKGNAKARAAEIINQAELIKGAFTVYKIELGTITIDKSECDVSADKKNGCLAPLIDKQYLTDIPVGAEGWYIDDTDPDAVTLKRTLGSDIKACAIANYVNGAKGIPANPEGSGVDVESLKTNNITEFKKYIPDCSALTGSDNYICCNN